MKRLFYMFLSLLCAGAVCAQTALTQKWEAMMTEAKKYAAEKDYAKAIECNEALIKDMETCGVSGLIETLRNSNAIYYLYMGKPLMKSKIYKEAEAMFENAVANAKPSSQTMNIAHIYLGDVFASQSLEIRKVSGDLTQAIAFSVKAEKEYELAGVPDKRLKEQVVRAGMLRDVMKVSDAKSLLLETIKECDGNAQRFKIRGNALSELGCIEQDEEDFQNAIKHLEEGYDILIQYDKRLALLPAIRLAKLYRVNIPDNEKAKHWDMKVTELKNEHYDE